MQKDKQKYGLLLLDKIVGELHIIKHQILEKTIFDTHDLKQYVYELYELLTFDYYEIPQEFKQIKKEYIRFPKKIKYPELLPESPILKIEFFREYEKTYRISARKINFFNETVEKLRVIANKYPDCLQELGWLYTCFKCE